MVPYSVVGARMCRRACGGEGGMGGRGRNHQDGGSGMWLSRWLRLLVALVICVAALGCGSSAGTGGGDSAAQQPNGAPVGQSSGTPGSPGGSPQGHSGGAPGAPGPPSNGKNAPQAIGAPIKLPAFTLLQGQPLAKVRSMIAQAIKDRCDGEPCPKLRDEQVDDPNFTSCQFIRTIPDTTTPTEVARDATIVVVSGKGSCTPEGSTQSSEEQPTGDTAPPDSTEPPPTDTTAPDAAQPPSST
jgi:hypothetical protein